MSVEKTGAYERTFMLCLKEALPVMLLNEVSANVLLRCLANW